MYRRYEQIRCRQCHLRLRLVLLVSVVLLFLTDLVVAQQNVTLDDTDLFIFYAPATSWHSNLVECDTCLSPPSSLAHGGTWHEGTHIIPTIDGDGEPAGGDPDGDGTTGTSATLVSSGTLQPAPVSSPQPAQTSAANIISDNDDYVDDGDDGDNDHGGKGKGDSDNGSRRFRCLPQSVKWRWDTAKTSLGKRDDSDDSGFQDVPVTATVNFTGQAIYVFAILPLFPAPSNTTPTFTNLSFSVDGSPHGLFTYKPDPTVPGTPTVNSSDTEKYRSNVNIFSVVDLEDADHILIVNVGVDSVFLLDYVIYTAGASDPTNAGSITTSAPDSERTAGDISNSTTNSHNVATFAGAIGGSFGLLSAIALGLCISIKCRRRRARVRETQRRAVIAQTFTSRDHGDVGPEDDEESVFGRQANGPGMAQASSAPFVPRYFPGSLPASPPPYAADAEGERVIATSPVVTTIDRAGIPVPVPSRLPPIIPLPTATLDLQRTTSNNSSHSYADRPPPTPPDEDIHFSLFAPPGVRDDRNLNGGVVGPLPVDTPSNEESDPMLGVEVDNLNGEEDRTSARRMSSESVHSHTLGASRSSRNSDFSEPSGTTPSSSSTPYSLPTSSASISAPLENGSKREDATTFPTLSTSTSLPSFSTPSSSRLLTRPSVPELAPKPPFQTGLNSFVYPLLQPSRIPLPPSIYESDVDPQEALERRESRS